jgi:SAM-dependent methyltransferase
MYHDIQKALQEVDKTALGKEVLSVSRSLALCRLLDLPDANVFDADYPEYDVLNLAFGDNRFDYLVCDQVLEHVRGDPQRAVDETRRVLRLGGVAIHTTCLLEELHGIPHDYWRFTPYGLRYLFRDFTRVVQAGSWGNKLAFLGFRYLDVPHAAWHPIRKVAMMNDPESPIVTWIVAQK